MEEPAASFLRAIPAGRALHGPGRQRVGLRPFGQEQIFGRKALGDEPARRESGLQILAVDDGESEAARRCGMVFRWFRLMEGNLETHDARHGAYRALQLGRRVAIVPAMPAEE